VKAYVTGDLAFQTMVFGKESMSGHWCMQCTMQMQCTLTQEQLIAVKRWTMEEYCRLGDEAEKRKGEPKLGVKKKPWWPFIPVSHYMVPLLHCEIGIGNQLLDMLREIINEYLENMTRTEERMRASIPILNKIISETTAKRDLWDASDDEKLRKKLKRNVAMHFLLAASEDSANNDAAIVVAIAPATAADVKAEENNLRTLEEFRNKKFVDKPVKARRMVSDQQLKLKTMRTLKVKEQGSIVTKIFSVLKEIGVALSAYHGRNLNVKDIKKVMTTSSHSLEFWNDLLLEVLGTRTKDDIVLFLESITFSS